MPTLSRNARPDPVKSASPGGSDPLGRADWMWMIGLALAALLVRYAFLLQARSSPLFDKIIMDARSYWEWSDRIAAGDWLGKNVFYQAPLYPYVLGLLKSVGVTDLWTIKVVQVALGSAACSLLYLAARRWFDRSVAVVSGAMLAVYPPAIFYDSIIQKANLGLVLTVLMLWALAGACMSVRWWRSALLGAVLGLLMLTREESILLLPVLAIVLIVRGGAGEGEAGLWGRWGAIAAPAAFLLGAAVVLAPVGVRNKVVGGEFALTTSQAGPNFYIGNNPDATGVYAPLRPGRSNTPFERRDAFELAEQATGRTLTPAEVSHYWRSRAFAFITGEPGRWLALMGRKSMLLINAFEVPDAESQDHAARSSSLLRTLAGVWHMGVLVPLAGAGLVLTLRRWRDLWPLYLVIATTAGAVVLFYVFGRYRYPLVPMLIPFAAAAVVGGVRAVWDRNWPALAAAGAAVIPLAILANYPMFDRPRELASAISNAGAALAESGDDRAAVDLYTDALALEPALPDTLANLAAAQARLGDTPAAMTTLARALAMRPDDPRMHFRMGTLKAQLGDLPGAADHLARAVKGGPRDLDSAVNYGAVLLQLGRWPEAAAHLRAAAGAFPNDPVVHANLAFLLATCPDAGVRNGADAVSAAERAIAIAPAPSADLLDILGMAHAETGDFRQALAAAERALALARSTQSQAPPELVREIESHIEMYKAGRAVVPRQELKNEP